MGKTREEIERALLAAVQAARTDYERAKAIHRTAKHLASDLETGNSDRVLALNRENQATSATRRALIEYREALRRFTDFVVAGKLPEDD